MSGYRPIYTHDEDMIILKAIIETESHYRIRGRAFWEDLSNCGYLDRTWQSLKERFEKILLRINDYEISADHKKEIQLAHYQLITVFNLPERNNNSDDEHSDDESDEVKENDETDDESDEEVEPAK